MNAPIPLDGDEFAPRDDANRFRIYSALIPRVRLSDLALDPGSVPAPTLVLLATAPTAAGVGACLVTLAEEGQITPETRVGVLDALPGGEPAETGTWIVNPYAKGDRP